MTYQGGFARSHQGLNVRFFWLFSITASLSKLGCMLPYIPMENQLTRQHQIDQHLSGWAKKNEPPLWVRYVVGLFLISATFAPVSFNEALMFVRGVTIGESVAGINSMGITTIAAISGSYLTHRK